MPALGFYKNYKKDEKRETCLEMQYPDNSTFDERAGGGGGGGGERGGGRL